MKNFPMPSARHWGVVGLLVTLIFATQLGASQPRPSAAPWVRNTANPSLVELGIPAEDIVVIGVIRTLRGRFNVSGTLYLADGLLSCGLQEGCIGPGALRVGSVSAASIAPGAIDGAKIAAGAITGSHLAPNAIDSSKLANGAVSLAKLAPCSAANQFLKWTGTAWACEIAPIYSAGAGLSLLTNNVFSIADNGVTTAKLANQSITTAKLAIGSVDSSILKDGSVLGGDIGDGEIGAGDIADGAVGTAAIADNSIQGIDIMDDAITATDLAVDAVTNSELASNAVGSAELQINAVDGTKIMDGSVSTSELADLAITKDKLVDKAIDSSKLADGAVDSLKLANAAVTFSKLASCATATQILKWSGTAWACATDNSATYTVGTGLSLANNVFSVDTNAIQSRVSGNCNAGTAMQAINANGTVACGSTGTITAVTAGAGLTGGGSSNNVTLGVANNGITNAMIQDGAVTPSKLGSCAVTNQILKWTGTAWACAADIGANYVAGAGLLLSGSLEFSVALGGIATAMLADGAVTPNKLAPCTPTPTSASNQFLLWEGAGSGAGWKCADLAGNLDEGWSRHGNALKQGEFLGTTNNEPFEIRVNNSMALKISPEPPSASPRFEFELHADRGMNIFSRSQGPTTGVRLAPGSNAWSQLSDRHLKENVTPVNGRLILEKLRFLPITRWNLKSQNSAIKHIGPMAQDFYAAFGLGESNRYINASDADGIALLSIQALYFMSLEKEQEIKQLQKENQDLRTQLSALQKRLEALEQAVQSRK